MAQRATQAVGDQLGHNSHVVAPYVYDVEHRGGLAIPTLKVEDLDGSPAQYRVGSGSLVCPVRTGACVSSVTGGTVTGFDMYGQPLTETLAPTGTGNKAFATVSAGPADVKFANKYGLPYRYAGAAVDPTAGITIQAPAAGDKRGTFTVNAGVTGPAEYEVRYMADRSNLYGDALVDHSDAGEVGGTAVTVEGTVDSDGVIVVTLPLAEEGKSAWATVTFPDGTTVRAERSDDEEALTEVEHTLKPEWMSRYARVIDEDALARQVAVSFDDATTAGTYVELTGSLV